MNTYRIRYIHGFQGSMKQEQAGTVTASSLQEALRSKSDWPIEARYDCTSAWAKNPGTSLYYVEAWEADLCAGPGREELPVP